MNEDELLHYITDTFAGVETASAFGCTMFFHGPDRLMPFATVADSDSDHDRVSNLDRTGVYRLNIGVGPELYETLLGPPPAPPGPSGIVETGHDFAALDEIMPHPTYAPQAWVCVLNPGPRTLKTVKKLLAQAHALAVRKNANRVAHGIPPTS